MIRAAAEHTNEYRGADNGWPASTERSVEHYRQRFVGDDVAQEQCDQDPMLAALEESQHARRILALVSFARMSKHLEVNFILTHKTVQGQYEGIRIWTCYLRDGQTCEDTTGQNEREGHAQIENQACIFLGELLVGKGTDDPAKGKRNSFDNGREGVEETDEEHVDAGHAIGCARARSRGGNCAHGRSHS